MAILQEILCLVAQNGSQRHREITTFFYGTGTLAGTTAVSVSWRNAYI
jgi:hypothetical protein